MALTSIPAHMDAALQAVGLRPPAVSSDSSQAEQVPQFQLTESALRKLASQAQGRNPEALSLLVQVACDGGGAVQSGARALLMQLQADPQTPQEVREELLEQAFAMFDVCQKAGTHTVNPESSRALTGKDMHRHLPTEILYFAGLHANRETQPGHHFDQQQAQAIHEILRTRVTSGVDIPKEGAQAGEQEVDDLLKPCRFINQSELEVATRRCAAVPVFDKQIDINSADHAQGLIRTMTCGMTTAGEARTVFIKTGQGEGSHWVTAVLVRQPGNQDKAQFECLLFDSLGGSNEGEKRARSVHELLAAYVPAEKFQVVGDALQGGAPSSCGAYATLVATIVNAHRETQQSASLDDIANHLRASVQQWKDLSDEQRSAMIVAERAKMLTTWAHVVSAAAR